MFVFCLGFLVLALIHGLSDLRAWRSFSLAVHQEKHFESQTVMGFMDVPRESRQLSEPLRHA